MDFVAKNILTALVAVLPATAVFAQGADVAPQSPTASVAVALHDKNAYLQQQYSPDALPKKIFNVLAQSGGKPASFKRISIGSKFLVDKTGAALPMSSDTDSFYENAGNGFVKQINVVKLNGFEQGYFFELSYKGVITLRGQNIPVNATTMPPISDMIYISHFDGAVDGPRFSYTAASAFNTSNAATVEFRYNCSAGSSYPASQINPAIQGSAHDVGCQILNANGIVVGITRYGYLEKYGFAIFMYSKSPSQETSKTVTSFKEE